jgi:cytochrome c oxidase subunit I
MLYAIGFIGLFTIGGMTGLFLAASGIDVHVTDTYFVIAHFHYIMVGGTVMAYMGGLHYWWPKISGNVLSTAGASILRVGDLLPFLYFLWSWRYGPKAPPNPWRATGLERQTSSPPPRENFEVTPVVTRKAYDYEGMKQELGLA